MERVVLVTGASSGLGKSMALSLLEAGHCVVLSGSNERALEETREASGAGHRVAVVVADLANESEVSRLALAAETRFGRIDALVNNAGIAGVSRQQPQEVDPEDMRHVFEINTFAPVQLTRLLLPPMIRRGWGRIILIGTSLETMLRFMPYGMSKAATEAFMAALSGTLQSTGVTANVLLPGGMTATRMTQSVSGVMLAPEIMGPPITWLVSDASDNVTGRRFIAARWNPSLRSEHAAQACGAPVAWSGISDRAVSPIE